MPETDDQKAGGDAEQAADDDGQIVHARGEGIGTLDGLKVNGQVVDEGEEAARDEKDVGVSGLHAADFEEAGLQQSAVTHPKLICDESDEQEHESDYGNDD